MFRFALIMVLLNVNVRAYGTEGSPCTWGEYNGTCLNAHKCFTFIVDKREGNIPPICGFQGFDPIICCTECSGLHMGDIDDFVFNESLGLMQTNGRKYWDTCIDYIDALPYPGKMTSIIKKKWNTKSKCHMLLGEDIPQNVTLEEDTRRGEFPFMALLGYGSEMDSARWLCGGTLISDRFILTAARCISTPIFGSVKFIALGVWKRSEPNELWQRYNVKTITPHPEYRSPSKYHDIALLETDKPVDIHEGCLPACLHSGEYYPYSVYALGWGYLDPRKHFADILQQVNLDLFTDSECAAQYTPYRHLMHGYDHTTQVCYGDHDEEMETCADDSGGPIIDVTEGPGPVGYTIIGVTSYGLRCGVTPSAGMYTRVAHYVPWIESVVWP